ncbi:RimK/LysX family protein [Gilvimarinus sp. DA14]|uniref:putative ATP-dependent zinc protease n=1 Tax=Gilvimarinus sp. DA14 TaxID=2956798 RepID=UPI0020B737C8|nr:RimK/LysX family protein [Gilvimarinus sp. DA14]UTF59085.1 RimK/LysX family protein [Gilvimarinus sp. DA14]
MSVFKGLLLATLVIVTSGCSNHYRLVKTTDLESVNQCAMVSDHNHQQLLLQQQELAGGMQQLQTDLNATREQIQTLAPAPARCPDPSYTPPVSQPQSVTAAVEQADKQMVGALEQLRFEDLSIDNQARIDTGIATAILPVRDLQPFERNGEAWVRFLFVADSGKEQEVERQVVRQASLTGSDKQRPVVRLRFTLGSITQHGEFILTERKSDTQELRLGRLVLRDVMVVDVSRDNLTSLPEPQGAK